MPQDEGNEGVFPYFQQHYKEHAQRKARDHVGVYDGYLICVVDEVFCRFFGVEGAYRSQGAEYRGYQGGTERERYRA